MEMIDYNRYISVRELTESHCKTLETEDYVVQPELFTSPTKWHLAHTTWFFEEMILKNHLSGYAEYHPQFNFLFNSYYNNVGERVSRIDRGNLTRPTVEEVYAYRNFVNDGMKLLFENDLSKSVLDLIELGLNHEQQHQELLLADIKYVLGHNPLFPVFSENKNLIDQYNEQTGFVKIKEGVYKVGSKGESFSFDNELGRHQTFIQNCEISRSLVTNGEFIEFIEAGGYSNFNLWLDEGWAWVNENQVNSPLYWEKRNGDWFQYAFNGFQKVDKNAIFCHVCFYEANAYAAWKGMRLPTEFEWEVASTQLNWGSRWEWTNSAYLPYPKFKIAKGAVGEYNGKFMVNQMVLRGGSAATSPNHSRKTYRNFFHPQYQWQFSGIRLVK